MKTTAIIRLAVYGIAALTGAVVAVIATVNQDGGTLGVALGWIATNVLAGANVTRGEATEGEHAA